MIKVEKYIITQANLDYLLNLDLKFEQAALQ